mmetsp:Transcript_3861/g.7085  ORF Transcript_3861/g.7085 Transcript_3861/m.7085 type:complete len:329 (+) Transcript_3861:203-1189(+)
MLSVAVLSFGLGQEEEPSEMYCQVSRRDGDPQRIFYKTYGDEDAKYKVLLTMGLGGAHYQWEPQLEFFKTKEDVIVCVYDNRGIGFSDPVSGRWTTRDMAQDALELLNHLGWKSGVHIVGLSMGGMITQELALLEPSRFASMTLISTIAGGLASIGLFAISAPSGIKTLLQTFTTTDPREQLRHGLKLLYTEEFLDQHSYNEDKKKHEPNHAIFRRALIKRGVQAKQAGTPDTKMLTLVKQALAVCTHRVSQEALGALGRHFGQASLVITGDQDILVHQTNSRILKKALKAKLLTLECAGHGANEQHAETVNEAIYGNIVNSTKQSKL